MSNHSGQNEGFRVLDEIVCQAIPENSAVAGANLNIEVEWPGVDSQDLADRLERAIPDAYRGLIRLSAEQRVGDSNAGSVLATVQRGGGVLAALIASLLDRSVGSQGANGKCVVITVPEGKEYDLSVGATPYQIQQVCVAVENTQRVCLKIVLRS